MNKIKAALEAKLEELEERAEDIADDLAEAPNADWDENAKESEDDEVLSAIGNLAVDDIRHIELALGRIESGCYGICVACSKPIAEERLKVIPHAGKCVNCESQ